MDESLILNLYKYQGMNSHIVAMQFKHFWIKIFNKVSDVPSLWIVDKEIKE